MISKIEESAMNRQAEFLPARQPAELPCVEVAGIRMYAYIRDGMLNVSVDLEEADRRLRRPDRNETVPMQVMVSGRQVFRG